MYKTRNVQKSSLHECQMWKLMLVIEPMTSGQQPEHFTTRLLRETRCQKSNLESHGPIDFYQFSQTTFSIKSIIIGGVEQNELVENCKRLAVGLVSIPERNLQITNVFSRWPAFATTYLGPVSV